MPVMEITCQKDCNIFEKNFNNDRVIIIYYWNSCPHCHTLMETFDELMDNYQNILNRANIYKVEYDNLHLLNPMLRNVSAFPYIISYNNGKVDKEFSGQRDESTIKKFIEDNSSRTHSRSQTKIQSKTPKIRLLKSSKKNTDIKKSYNY